MGKQSNVLTAFIILLLAISLTKILVAGEKDSGKTSSKSSNSQPLIQSDSKRVEIVRKTGNIQMPFIANNGQIDERVAFYAKTFGGTVFVTKGGEIVYVLPNNSSELKAESLVSDVRMLKLGDGRQEAGGGEETLNSKFKIKNAKYENPKSTIQNLKSGVALKEELVGGKVSNIKGEEKAVTKVSYFRGNDSSKWKSDISTYDTVSLGEVYDGIELRLKAYGNNVEKLFCVKPGADPEKIRIRVSGVKECGMQDVECGIKNQKSKFQNLSSTSNGDPKLWLNEYGELEAETELGTVKFTKPVAYQEIDGRRVNVAVDYTIQKPEEKNRKPAISRQTELINPKSTIQNSSPTSIGDSKSEYGFTVASYDKTGELVIDPLLASTFLGGSDGDYGNSIAIDSDGNIYVAGWTHSEDFPATIGAYDTSYNSSSDENFDTDVFVSKLNGSLTSLLASTFLGGSSGYQYGSDIAIDSDGNVYVTGYNQSEDFPTTSGAYDISGGQCFISKLNGSLTSLLSSTYLNSSYCNAIAIDSGGNVYVTGSADSNLPTTPGAYDTSYNDTSDCADAFISKLNGSLTSLLASTYLGGFMCDWANAIAIDQSGNIFVTGKTDSKDFPATKGAYDTTVEGHHGNVFVSKLNGSLTKLRASTLLGGEIGEGNAIAIDLDGSVYVTGNTDDADFPVTDGAYDTSYNGGYCGVFVSKLDGKLKRLIASTFLSGGKSDGYSSGYGNDIVIDSEGDVYVAGYTDSEGFPTTLDAYDTSLNGEFGDVFISKLNSKLTRLLASTYFGGTEEEAGDGNSCTAIAIGSDGDIYVTGGTGSSDFPVTEGAYDVYINGDWFYPVDVFVSKFDSNLSVGHAIPTVTPLETPTPIPTPTPTPTPACVAETIVTSTDKLTLNINESDMVTVTVTGKGGCYVEGGIVDSIVDKAGQKYVSVSPSSTTTNANGEAMFTITAKDEAGKARVSFFCADISTSMEVKVVK